MLYRFDRGGGVEAGIEFEIIWFDQDEVEIVCGCSNACFSGQAEIYLSYDDLAQLADKLSGFPTRGGDSRDFEIGTFHSEHADGGMRMHFYCLDVKGHVAVDVRLRGDACKALGEPESVALRIPLEPAAIDFFVLQLRTMSKSTTGGAFLPMAK